MDDRDTAPGEPGDEPGSPLAGLTDWGRGLLASALLAACQGENIVARLRLDSADPSLMSRADVAWLLAHLREHDGAALGRALRPSASIPR